jgi:hypothetical protein
MTFNESFSFEFSFRAIIDKNLEPDCGSKPKNAPAVAHE